MASTVTLTTRGGESTVGVTRVSSRASEEDVLRNHMRTHSEEFDISTADGAERPRSRSQSPLTVQSAATGTQSVGESASFGPSILSTAAVAPSRSFGTRRANAAAANAQEQRAMAERVVSFTTNDLANANAAGLAQSGVSGVSEPDELDNVSDIADAFSNSARVWREEYEARLDAIHKRLGSN